MEKFDRSALGHNQERADRYHDLLMGPEGDPARKYLEGRGLTEDLVREYQLGLCDDLYPGRLAIPYRRPPHGVIWFNYRALNGEAPKYLASGPKHLFNTWVLDQADESGEVWIAEGEFDAIVATHLCGLPTVGIPGATQWTGNRHWHELFVGYQRVWVLADPDDAGLQLATAILDRLPAARLVSLPADVTDTYLAFGGLEEFVRG